MSQSPPCSRIAFLNTTNVYAPDGSDNSSAERKRSPSTSDAGRDAKRVKLSYEDTPEETQSKRTEIGNALTRIEPPKHAILTTRSSLMMAPLSTLRRYPALSTRPILRSFVSSNKTDVFRCYATEGQHMSNPYACGYSHDAKRGGTHLLAIATESGAVHVLNATKRDEWDCGMSFPLYELTTPYLHNDKEPQRVVWSPHNNGLFDIQWSPSDTLLATASGDQTTRISSLASSVSSEDKVLCVLRGQESTVRCVAWDPSRDDILCTGGRNGSICVWDLRVGEGRSHVISDFDTGSAVSGILAPVLVVPGAHEDSGRQLKPRGRKGKITPSSTLHSITNLLYDEANPTCIISSGSTDGILRKWDLRLPIETTGKSKKPAKTRTSSVCISSCDPTTFQGVRRARGIVSLESGRGPTAGLLYALGTDARIHTYSATSLEPLSGYRSDSLADDPFVFSHPELQTNSFYVHLALSPCGRWLACGSATGGRAFLFDVSNTASAGYVRHDRHNLQEDAVVLRGQMGEVGALDWAEGSLATCADDTTVRIWRPDIERAGICVEGSEEMKWTWSWAEQ
ncbi:uncharacterized protein FIBRA_04925 [Fibroporia radiculosa]|uniref:Uncharacterized protein n=1 Tax=Fibroporia radiculosa TaxID=599839 RepID=J4G864_9APHY|nr:uncharacterized protein FIBRA_04925 [Fibroporia radiculosa]CCM02813.1 predicted protein [Fibroporia radiculosa]